MGPEDMVDRKHPGRFGLIALINTKFYSFRVRCLYLDCRIHQYMKLPGNGTIRE